MASSSWALGENTLAGVILGIALLLLIILISYVLYEYRNRRRSLSSLDRSPDQPTNGGTMSDTNKEIVVYHQGTPVTLRLIQTPSGMYCRIVDELQENLLAEKAESVAVIDRVEQLSIGSTDFDRAYETVISKFAQAESLRGLSFNFNVANTSTSSSSTSTAEPYAEANLSGDGRLVVYSRNRRRTAMLSVEWLFPMSSSGGRYHQSDPEWEHFGRIFDTNQCLKYELKLSTEKSKKGHSYALFHKKSPEAAFLKISGKPRVTHWAASQTGMSKTAIVFKVYAKALDNDRKIQLATIEPAIDGHGPAPSIPEGAAATIHQDARRPSVQMFTSSFGDQLYSIKFKSQVIDPETKSAILGVAFLLCLRHCMKGLYRTFERITMSK